MQSQLDKTEAVTGGLYDEDFFEWTRRCAELSRAGRFEQADREQLIYLPEDRFPAEGRFTAGQIPDPEYLA